MWDRVRIIVWWPFVWHSRAQISLSPWDLKALGDSFRLQNPNVGDLSVLKNWRFSCDFRCSSSIPHDESMYAIWSICIYIYIDWQHLPSIYPIYVSIYQHHGPVMCTEYCWWFWFHGVMGAIEASHQPGFFDLHFWNPKKIRSGMPASQQWLARGISPSWYEPRARRVKVLDLASYWIYLNCLVVWNMFYFSIYWYILGILIIIIIIIIIILPTG